MNAFVDSFGSRHVQVHFDSGNVMLSMLTILLSCGMMPLILEMEASAMRIETTQIAYSYLRFVHSTR